MRESDKLLSEILRLRDENQEFQAKIGDLTAQAYKRIEEEAKYQSLFHDMSEGVVICAEDGTIESFHPAAEAIFGRNHVDVTGSNLSELFWICRTTFRAMCSTSFETIRLPTRTRSKVRSLESV